jgi:hypothetical protein
MAKPGRPRKYADSGVKPAEYVTKAALSDKVEEYFQCCKDNNTKPNKQGLAVFLDVTTETINDWKRNENNNYPEFSFVIKKALDRMSDLFQQRTDAMALLSVNQEDYGGITNRPDTSAKDVNITVKIANGDEKLVD